MLFRLAPLKRAHEKPDANINIQMNYWSALTTFPSTPELQLPLFEYILKSWVPRGEDTASLVYGIDRGFVAHSSINVCILVWSGNLAD